MVADGFALAATGDLHFHKLLEHSQTPDESAGRIENKFCSVPWVTSNVISITFRGSLSRRLERGSPIRIDIAKDS
jgi:hypothetical protein